ncbi:F-box protein CPR1-like [Oryza brachyantha]|uniref:F-box protein CPR1-like n=1 Tax=Oryza brachyantha TaxID=4533 RepID=UPI001ADB131F|nr:F-box protein CPR1-like [Oryza brachyantha]
MASSSAAAAEAPGGGLGALDGVLPPELLLDVLLRLAAKPICRLRAVCRSWLAFTSDPHFVAAHAARHPGPLLAVGVQGFPRLCVDLVDLSGNVVKQILRVGKGMVVGGISGDRAFLAGEDHSVRVLDPTTGSISCLPHHRSNSADPSMTCVWFAFGQTASTGEYKLVRIMLNINDSRQVAEVITISDMNAQWRKIANPPGSLDWGCNNGVVFKGAAYFIVDYCFSDPSVVERGRMPSFDLATEQWSVTLKGPANRILEESNGTLTYHDLANQLMLAGLKGTLSIAHCNDQFYAVDIWFLLDAEKGTWSKGYRISVDVFYGIGDYLKVQPLLVTDEGKVVLWMQMGSKGVVQIYDPVTDTSLDIIQTSTYTGASVYTGSLLHPGSV